MGRVTESERRWRRGSKAGREDGAEIRSQPKPDRNQTRTKVDWTGFKYGKKVSKKDSKKTQDGQDKRTRSRVRLEVIRRQGNRSRFSGVLISPRTCHVHEIPSRAQGGDPLDPACCIAITPTEHGYMTLGYVEAVLVDPRRGTLGRIDFQLTTRGQELLGSQDRRRAQQRETFLEMWRRGEGRH